MRHTLLLVTLLFCFSALDAQLIKRDKPFLNFPFSSVKELSAFAMSDTAEWVISKNGNGGKCLKQLGVNNVKDSTVTSTLVINNHELGSFIMEVDVMQTPSYYNLVHLDILFGYKSDSQFCYAQLASRANRFVHNLFVKKGDEAVRVLDKQDKGVAWGFEKWHSVRVERYVEQKSVKVFVDDRLIFESDDERLMQPGLVGLGNSGDCFKIDNLKIWTVE